MASLKADKDKMAKLDQNSSSTAPEQIFIALSVPNSEPFVTRLCDMITFSSTDCFTKFDFIKTGSETKGEI